MLKINYSEDESALNLLYQLSINDDAKAMITYTDAIQCVSSVCAVEHFYTVYWFFTSVRYGFRFLFKLQSCLRLLHILSMHQFGFEFHTFQLMRKVLTDNASDTVKAVLINIALEKRNAQLLCGTDGQGLDLLLETALSHNDQLLLKVVRNISTHSGPTQAMFSVKFSAVRKTKIAGK